MNRFTIPQSVYCYFHSLGYDNWLTEIPSILENISCLEKINFIRILPNCRAGLVILGLQGDEDRVVKIMPANMPKFKNEVSAYKYLHYSFMMKPLKINENLGYYIMPRLYPLPSTVKDSQTEKLVYMRKIWTALIAEYWHNTDGNLYPYSMKMQANFSQTKKIMEWKEIFKWIERAQVLYKAVFMNSTENYSLHGDLHIQNIMLNSEGKVNAIDPLGFYASIEFEFVRFIENEIFDHTWDFEREVNRWIDEISLYGIERRRLLCSLFVDSVLRTTSSILQCDSKEIIKKGIYNAEEIWKLL